MVNSHGRREDGWQVKDAAFVLLRFFDFGAGNKLVQVGVDVLRNPAIELIENSPGLSATLWLTGPVFILRDRAAARPSPG
jgi:hypothetical protein